MAFGDPKLPRATLRGENLSIEGDQEPYFRVPSSTISLRVDALSIQRGYDPEDPFELTGERVLTEHLRGNARFEGRDRFGVAGLEVNPDTPIVFTMWSVADAQTKFHWRANIGFHPADWERDGEDEFWVMGYCTKRYFDDLMLAARAGHLDHIRVSMTTTLWTKDKASSFVELPRTWNVAPSTTGESSSPDVEHGKILSLKWEEKFGVHPLKGNDDEPAARKPTVIELPARVYLSLNVLIAIGAVLVTLTLLRH